MLQNNLCRIVEPYSSIEVRTHSSIEVHAYSSIEVHTYSSIEVREHGERACDFQLVFKRFSDAIHRCTVFA